MVCSFAYPFISSTAFRYLLRAGLHTLPNCLHFLSPAFSYLPSPVVTSLLLGHAQVLLYVRLLNLVLPGNTSSLPSPCHCCPPSSKPSPPWSPPSLSPSSQLPPAGAPITWSILCPRREAPTQPSPSPWTDGQVPGAGCNEKAGGATWSRVGCGVESGLWEIAWTGTLVQEKA